MTNKELIKEYVLIHANICHKMKSEKDFNIIRDLIDAGLMLDKDLKRRKISENDIINNIKDIKWSAEEEILIKIYLYPDLIEIAKA